MADDHESKTEAPTERRVREALDKGDIPFSREAPVFASILGLLLGLSLFARGQAARLAQDLAGFLDHPHGFALESAGDAAMLLQAVAGATGRFLLPFLLLLAACGLSASVLQNVPRLVADRIRPKWRAISPASGFSRIFGRPGQVEFLKSLLKVLGISLVVVLLLRSERQKAVNAMFVDPSQLPELILTLSIRLISAVSVATIVIVAGDLVWARLRWQRSLRMSASRRKRPSASRSLLASRLRRSATDPAMGRGLTCSRLPEDGEA
jgi:flagellar biosynthetic protein FlhB